MHCGPCHYLLVFAAGAYFRRLGVALPEPPFVDEVVIEFGIADAAVHCHVPLVVSAWSTRRTGAPNRRRLRSPRALRGYTMGGRPAGSTGNALGVRLRVAAPKTGPSKEAQRDRSEGAFTRAGGSHAGSARGLEGEGVRGKLCACPANRVSAITSPATKSPRSSAPPRKARATAYATTR